MRRSIDFSTLDNSGNGYCGPYCIIQASDFVEFKSSDATYQTRNGSTESGILQRISEAMVIMKKEVSSNKDSFSKRSYETVQTWSDEV